MRGRRETVSLVRPKASLKRARREGRNGKEEPIIQSLSEGERRHRRREAQRAKKALMSEG